MFRTPFLIKTNYNSFNEYLTRLTAKSRYQYKHVIKKYKNINFNKISRCEGIKIKNNFETLWSKQLIRGKSITKPNLPLKQNTLFFTCVDHHNVIISLHIIEEYHNYCYSHMPMYDKNKYEELSKFSWFSLIKYMIENMNKMGLDMGGSCGRSLFHNCNGNCNPHFKYIVENRNLFDKYQYKFLYLTKEEKKKPAKLIILRNKLQIKEQ